MGWSDVLAAAAFLLASVWVLVTLGFLILAASGTRAYDRAEREDREVKQFESWWDLPDPEHMPEAEWLS